MRCNVGMVHYRTDGVVYRERYRDPEYKYYCTDLARVEGNSGDGVEVAFEAFSQSEPFNGGGLKHEVQERVLHLQQHHSRR